jgi:hypothetical protein
MRDERTTRASRRIAATFWAWIAIVLALGMFGCGVTEPEPVSIDGDWTFVADAPPCTWTLDATFYGTTAGEGTVTFDCGEEAGSFRTSIVGVLHTANALAFFEGGCQYLLTLTTPDRFDGIVDCGGFAGTVEGHRVRP